jgi:hypothetical protein
MILSIIAGALTVFGATYGGSLVFDYGFNVETAGDHRVWHQSETDVMSDQKEPVTYRCLALRRGCASDRRPTCAGIAGPSRVSDHVECGSCAWLVCRGRCPWAGIPAD